MKLSPLAKKNNFLSSKLYMATFLLAHSVFLFFNKAFGFFPFMKI